MKTLKLSALLTLFFLVASFSQQAATSKTNKLEDDEFQVKFRIQIGAYENHVPYDKVETMRKLGEVKVVKQDGRAYYYSKPYATEQAATSNLGHYINVGFEDAHEVVELEDSFVSLADYHKILAKDDEDPEKKSVIRIYKH